MTWPIPIPTWFWTWARWRLGRSEFKEFGPANPLVRPSSAPKKIPSWAWERLKLLLGSSSISSSYNGILLNQGAWLRNPRGGVEDVHEMYLAGVKWLGINVGDHALSEWETIRNRARLYGVLIVPWARVRNIQDIYKLITIAKAIDSKAIGLNLESEAKTTLSPALCRETIDSSLWLKEVIVFTEAWVYNDVDSDPNKNGWEPLLKYPVLLEIFPQESSAAKLPDHCVAHAKEIGFKDVFLCYGSYWEAQPLWYNLDKKPYSIFTGDDIGPGNWNKWF